MTDQLAQIIAKLPLQKVAANQLQALFKQLDGQVLTSILEAQTKQDQSRQPHNSDATLTLKLPIDSLTDAQLRKLSNNSSNTQAQNSVTSQVQSSTQSTQSTQASTPPQPVINLPITEKTLIDWLLQLNRSLELPLIIKFSQNKVSFELPDVPPPNTNRTTNQAGSYSSALPGSKVISEWAAQPKPLVQFKFALQSSSQESTTGTANNRQEKITGTLSPISGKSNDKSVDNQSITNKADQSKNSDNPKQLNAMRENSNTSQLGQLKQSFIQNQKPLTESAQQNSTAPKDIGDGIKNAPLAALNSKYSAASQSNVDKVTLKDTLSVLRQIESKADSSKQPLTETMRTALADLAKFIKQEQSGTQLSSNAKSLSLVERWLNQIPRGENIGPKNLFNAIQKSGVFFEQNIAQLSNSLPNKDSLLSLSGNSPSLHSSASGQNMSAAAIDLKNILLILQQTLSAQASQTSGHSLKMDKILHPDNLTQGLSALFSRFKSDKPSRFNRLAPATHSSETIKLALSNVENGINRLQMVQAQNLSIDPSQPASWVFEIPFMAGEKLTSIQMQLEQHSAQNNNEKQKSWRITIRFDLENLGVFNAITQLKGEQLDIQFNAVNETTQQLLASEMPALKNTLVNAGLLVGSTNAQHGDAPDLIATKVSEKLVDVRI